MNSKPSDLFLSVIEFFGILVPGSVLVFLHGNFLLKQFNFSVVKPESAADWIPAFFISYIFGHILLGFSVPFNRFAKLSKNTKEYYKSVCRFVKLPVKQTYTSVYYYVFSYIRIHSSNAMAELERQAAEYKLFRSLIFLFIIDIPLTAFSGQFSLTRLLISLIGIVISVIRFDFLFDWTHQLAFGYFLQLKEDKTDTKQPGESH